MSSAKPTPVVIRRDYGPRYSRDDLIAMLRAWADAHDGVAPSALEWSNAEGTPSVSTVKRHFGSWANALRVAGLEPRWMKGGAPRKHAGKPCSNCGQTISSHAGSKGRCGRCGLFFWRTGVEWTPTRQSEFYAAQTALKEERWREAAALRNSGWADAEAAAILGVTKSTYSHRLTRARAAGMTVRLVTSTAVNGCWVPRFLEASWRAVLRGDPCAYCGAPAQHVDHIVPSSRGGEDDSGNWIGSCATCNTRKWATSLLHWMLDTARAADDERLALPVAA